MQYGDIVELSAQIDGDEIAGWPAERITDTLALIDRTLAQTEDQKFTKMVTRGALEGAHELLTAELKRRGN